MSKRVQDGLSKVKAAAGAAAAAIGAGIGGQLDTPKLPASVQDLLGDEDEEGITFQEEEEDGSDGYVQVTQDGVAKGYGADEEADGDDDDDDESVVSEEAEDLAGMVAAENKKEAAEEGRKNKKKRRKVTFNQRKSPPVRTAPAAAQGGVGGGGGSNSAAGGAAGTATATGAAGPGGAPTSNTTFQGAIERAIRSYMATAGPDEYDHELMSQAAGQSDKKADWEEVWSLAMALPGLQVFGWMKEGEGYVRTVHSLAKYVTFDKEHPLLGRTIGMVGDWTRYGPPQPHLMPKELMWQWFEVEICDDENAAEQFYADPNNRGKFWCPTGGSSTKKVWLPRLLYLVRDIAIFCATGKRTPWEVRNYAIQLLVSTNAPFQGTSLTLLKDYTMAACQCKATDNKKSILAMKLESAAAEDEHFKKMREPGATYIISTHVIQHSARDLWFAGR